MKKLFIIILSCTILLSNISAVNAESIGVNVNNEKEIDRIITDLIERVNIPGIAVSVTDESDILFEKGYGVESLETNKPMTENSVSAIGSITKSFTTLAVLQQVEKGKLNLDDKVIKYIPEFKTLDEEKSSKITVRMLLNNTSGLTHNVNFDIFSRETEDIDFMEAIKKNRTAKLLFDPGTAYNYSNEGFVIAGRILEIVTGMSYADYLEKYIFKPLNMSSTTTDIEKIKKMEVLYGHQGGIDTFIPSNKTHMGLMLPAGSETRSSVHELTHYLQMLMNRGSYQGVQLIGEDLFQETINKSVIPFDMYGYDLKYGYGWMHMPQENIQFHGGQTLSMSAMVMWDRDEKVGVSVLYNVASVNVKYNADIINLARDVLSLYSSRNYPHRSQPRLKRENLKLLDDQFYGNYISEDGYTEMVIEKDDNSIAYIKGVQGNSEFELSQMSSTQLLADNLAMETILIVERGLDDSIISIAHPMLGKFLPDRSLTLAGYSNLSWNGINFIYPQELDIDNNPDECLIKLTEGFLKITNLQSSEIPFPEEDNLIKETDLREVFMYGKRVLEKINIVNKNGTLYAHLYLRIEGEEVVGLTAEIPFAELTEVRARVIKPIIASLKFK